MLTSHLSYIGSGGMFHDLPGTVKTNGPWDDAGDVMTSVSNVLTFCLHMTPYLSA